jgi:aldehyde dehydrogenase (NAD+)
LAIVVTQDANLEMATRAILFGAVGTAGQRCTSTRRIIAHRSVAAKLAGRLMQAYVQVSIGDPLADGTLMGPLVVPDTVEETMQAIEPARSDKGELLYGGRRRPDIGPQFVELGWISTCRGNRC